MSSKKSTGGKQQQPQRQSPGVIGVTGVTTDESKQMDVDQQLTKQQQNKDRVHQQTLQQQQDVVLQPQQPQTQTRQQQDVTTQQVKKPSPQQQQTQITQPVQQQQQAKKSSPQQTQPTTTSTSIPTLERKISPQDIQRATDLKTARTMDLHQWQRAQIRQSPLGAHSWQFSSHHGSASPNPFPKALTAFLDDENLLSSLPTNNKPLHLFAQHLAGKVLTRDPDTKRFQWYTPSILHPNAVHYHQIQQYYPTDPTDAKKGQVGGVVDHEKLTRHCKDVWKNQVCPEIQSTNKNRFLHKYYQSKTEALLKTLQCDYLKLLRVVCDSYNMFLNLHSNSATCVENNVALPLDRPFCNIKCVPPKQQPHQSSQKQQQQGQIKTTNGNNNNNKKKTTTSTATTPAPICRSKSWTLSQECIDESIYDLTAITNLCTKTHYPTPLAISLHHDYRAPRVSWHNAHMYTLENSLNVVLRQGLLFNLTKYPSRLAQRIQLRDHCTLHLNDLCPNCDQKFLDSIEKRSGNESNNNNNNVKTTTTATQQHNNVDMNKRLQWANKIETFLNNNNPNAKDFHTITKSTKTYNCLRSLRPIDIWLLRTFIAQTRACCGGSTATTATTATTTAPNGTNGKNKKTGSPTPTPSTTATTATTTCPTLLCDIRRDKQRFAKDIADQAKKCSYTFQRTANSNWTAACERHKQTCHRLSCKSLRLMHLLSTSAPWSLYFTNTSFATSLSKCKSQLQPLPVQWNQLAEFMQNTTLYHIYQYIRLQSIGKRHTNNTQKQQQQPQQQRVTTTKVTEPFKFDANKRRVSTLITPSNLKSTKRSLRKVFANKRDANEWFHYLSHNPHLGRVLSQNEQQQSRRGFRQTSKNDSIIDNILGFFRK